MYAVATALGTLPVTLILVLTITMAAGTKVMVQRNVLVRNMRSLEALGGVTSKFKHTVHARFGDFDMMAEETPDWFNRLSPVDCFR